MSELSTSVDGRRDWKQWQGERERGKKGANSFQLLLLLLPVATRSKNEFKSILHRLQILPPKTGSCLDGPRQDKGNYVLPSHVIQDHVV